MYPRILECVYVSCVHRSKICIFLPVSRLCVQYKVFLNGIQIFFVASTKKYESVYVTYDAGNKLCIRQYCVYVVSTIIHCIKL